MERISTLFLRRELTRVIEKLEAGESFLVTHRGRAIGILQALPEAENRRMERQQAQPLDAVSPSAQTGQTGKATPIKTRQQVADEILRGVRTGKRE